MSSIRLERLNLLFGGDPKMNASAMARRLGISAGGLSRYRSGDREPTLRTFREMCLTFGVSADWLLGVENRDPEAGERPPPGVLLGPEQIRCLEDGVKALVRLTLVAGGDPYPEEMTAPERSERPAEPEVDPDPAPLPAEAVVPPKVAAEPVPEFREIPSVEVRASAGTGEMVFEEPKGSPLRIDPDRLPRWARSHTLSCIGAVGDSMEPEIHAGDVLVVATSCNEAVDGQIVVVHTDDGLVVKRNRKTEDGWELASDNPKYPPRPASDDDRIVGRVAWHGSRREAWGGSPED